MSLILGLFNASSWLDRFRFLLQKSCVSFIYRFLFYYMCYALLLSPGLTTWFVGPSPKPKCRPYVGTRKLVSSWVHHSNPWQNEKPPRNCNLHPEVFLIPVWWWWKKASDEWHMECVMDWQTRGRNTCPLAHPMLLLYMCSTLTAPAPMPRLLPGWKVMVECGPLSATVTQPLSRSKAVNARLGKVQGTRNKERAVAGVRTTCEQRLQAPGHAPLCH